MPNWKKMEARGAGHGVSEMYHGYQITGERKKRVKVSKKSGPNKTYLS